MILGLCCNGIKVLEFSKDYTQKFFGVITNLFAKKTHKRHLVSKNIDNFVNDLVIKSIPAPRFSAVNMS